MMFRHTMTPPSRAPSGLIRVALVAIIVAWGAVGDVAADGGMVLFRSQEEGLAVTAFAAPVPPRAGRVDFSFFIQDGSGDPLLDAEVAAWLEPGERTGGEQTWRPPCCLMEDGAGIVTPVAALRERGSNRLLYEALVFVPESGAWTLHVEARHGGRVARFAEVVRIEPPRPPLLAYWPLLALPVAAIGLFGLTQRAKRREHGKVV